MGCKRQNSKICVKVVDTEAGKECIKVIDGNHICAPVPYESEAKYRNIMKPNFELRANRYGIPNTSLIIFSSDDRSQCYKFQFTGFVFTCIGCRKLQKHLSGKMMKDKSGRDYFKMIDEEHVCQPRKYKPYKAPSETRCFNASKFELHPNQNGTPNGSLFVFASEDRKTGWKFCLNGVSFACIDCKNERKHTTAWIRKENGEQYIEVQNSHICKPRKYEKKLFAQKSDVPQTIFNSPNFELHPNCKGVPNGSLIIYESEARKLCWKFYLKSNYYACTACNKRNQNTAARLKSTESGQQFVEVRGTHVCEPKKFVPPKEFVGYTIIPSSEFVVCKNSQGKPNSRLILYTSDDKTSHYQFYLSNGNFRCARCNAQKKGTPAKLMTNESGEEYLQMKANVKHVCKQIMKAPKFK